MLWESPLDGANVKTGVKVIVHDAASPLFAVELVSLSENVPCIKFDVLLDHLWLRIPHIYVCLVILHVLHRIWFLIRPHLFRYHIHSRTHTSRHRNRLSGRTFSHLVNNYISGCLWWPINTGRPRLRSRICSACHLPRSIQAKLALAWFLVVEIRPKHLVARHAVLVQVCILVILYFFPLLFLTHFIEIKFLSIIKN